MNERLYRFLAPPNILPRGKQRQIVLEILANSKEPLSLGQIVSLATEKGLMAVGGVGPSCRYHLNYLSKLGCVEIVNPAPKIEAGELTEVDSQIEEMARHCYGYGRWDAPYWFIGLEEGMGSHETIQQRLDAWHQLEREGLSDCRDFHLHELIDDKTWHIEPVRLQSTWRPMMLLLMTFLDQPADIESLRAYQRCRWGRRDGETCVIELSGLPAHDLKVQRDRTRFRETRIEFIRKKMREHEPKLVVLYGRNARKHWKEIAEQPSLSNHLFDDHIFEIRSTLMVSTPSPTAKGMKNEYWIDLGKQLRARVRPVRG